MDTPLGESIIEALGILIWALFLFNFAFWVVAYTAVQLTKLAIQGKFLKSEPPVETAEEAAKATEGSKDDLGRVA